MVINGGLLAFTLIFQPQIAAGVFSPFGFLIVWGVFSAVLFAASCAVYTVIDFIYALLTGQLF